MKCILNIKSIDSEDEAPYDRTYADRSDDVIPEKKNFNAGKYGFKAKARTTVESEEEEGDNDKQSHAYAWEKKAKTKSKYPSHLVKHAGSDEESEDDPIRKPAYTFPKAARTGAGADAGAGGGAGGWGGGGSRAGSESGVEAGGYAGYGSEMATGMSTPTRSDTEKTPPPSRDPLNPFLVPRADAYKRRAHGSGAGASLGVGGDSGFGSGSGHNNNAAEESMSDILARMKLKTHASDAGGSVGGGSGGGSVAGDRGKLVGIRGGGPGGET